MSIMNTARYDVCISGSGAVAMSLALALSSEGWNIAWARAPQKETGQPDVRTYALNTRAIKLLERLRVWPSLKAHSAAVLEMDVRGDQGGALSFSAWQQCVDELAWIVDAAALERLLGEALRFAPRVTVVPPLSDAGQPPVNASLLAICEGKHSGTRAALGIEFSRQDYGHWGVAARLKASRAHNGVARQWFRSPDILALLPFNDPDPAASYGLVWSLPKERAEATVALPPEQFEQALMAAIAESDPAAPEVVGTLSLTSPVMAWPLALAQADRWCGPGWVLLGDAAHQVHPLAGQGLNLGLADVDTLVGVLVEARKESPWREAGDERTLRRYVRQREWPTKAMAGLTDALLHMFADDRGPIREVRNAGMALVQRLGPIKSWLIGRALDA
jgi:ubiquinone biosynthesis UbiH/UbiF/VisC/COQ6 family hydroxylase